MQSKVTGHIIVVVSPLISLMDDQVKHLTSLGVTAVSICSQSVFDVSKVEKGDYSLVFGGGALRDETKNGCVGD